MAMTYDVLTFGEAMLRLTPPDFTRMEQTGVLELHIGGSELNTVVGLARLGVGVRWVSRLTDNVVGRLIAGTLAGQGMDTSGVIWTDEDRIGVYYVEEGRPPRASRVTYDRVGSAVSRISLEDVDIAALFDPAPRLLHLTGITPALSAGCHAVATAMLEAAKARGVLVSFDQNYRAKLWGVATARDTCEAYMAAADVVFLPARDAETFYGDASLDALHARYPDATVVVTRGSEGAAAVTPDGETFEHPTFPAETVSRVGGGDAFSAGFLYGYLGGKGTASALRYGAAVAALKYTIPGDLPLVDLEQVEALVRDTGGGGIVR
jgi:2-dehydro-3-deoxygluconokinase